MGVEVPLSAFAGEQQTVAKNVLFLAASALLLTAVAILFFVDRFVQRPVKSLDKGVSRIAAGDYATPVKVRSHDELGRLAVSVNTMREQIASYIRHVDQSVERLEDVSRALTSTTSGVSLLQDSVLQAATGMAGEGSSAALLLKQGDDQLIEHAHQGTVHSEGLLQDPEAVRNLLFGQTARKETADGNLVAIPMTYQDQVTGGLLVALPPGRHLTDVDESALTTLAHNAIIAMENTRLFEQEKQTVERLRELDKLKNDFVSNAQHELRTPIAAITNNLELINIAWDQWGETEKKDVLQSIDSSTRAMGEIVETLIDMSLLSETVPLKPVTVKVAQAVDQAFDEISSHREGGIKVNIQKDISPELAVTADQKRFLQTLRALLDNSVKFTPDTGRIEVKAGALPDGTCAIEILDNGIGIPEDAMPHIFEPFYQANSAKTRTYGGMGMGLALVKRLVEVQGAQIQVQSVVDRGTMVRLIWPLATTTESVAAEETQDSFHIAKTRS
jgi:two-component system sensor histidine kinase ResE